MFSLLIFYLPCHLDVLLYDAFAFVLETFVSASVSPACLLPRIIHSSVSYFQELLLLEEDVNALEEMYPQGEKVMHAEKLIYKFMFDMTNASL